MESTSHLDGPGKGLGLDSVMRGNMLPGMGANDLSADQAVPQQLQPPFRFESRRSRIDWRLLHGVDINNIVRRTAVAQAACIAIAC